MARLCVYLGSNVGTSPRYAEAATRLGTRLAEQGLGLVYGGGKVGLMGILANAVLASGGEVIGVIPEHLVAKEVAHSGLSRLVVTTSMHERKQAMANLADGFIALPGGLGTIEEVTEILTWKQLGLETKPVVFLDVDGYWSPLLAMLDRAVDEGFMRRAHRALAQRAETIDDAIGLALAPMPESPPKWLGRDVR